MGTWCLYYHDYTKTVLSCLLISWKIFSLLFFLGVKGKYFLYYFFLGVKGVLHFFLYLFFFVLVINHILPSYILSVHSGMWIKVFCQFNLTYVIFLRAFISGLSRCLKILSLSWWFPWLSWILFLDSMSCFIILLYWWIYHLVISLKRTASLNIF